MKIYDCFSYWDEDLLLDLRLNILNDHVDYFVIVEGNKTWQNNFKELRFDINRFKKFEKKIIYIPVKDLPDGDNPYLRENHQTIHNNFNEPWNVTLVDTGYSTMTGGRIKRIKKYIKDEEAFFMTYGDGVSDIDINALRDFHFKHRNLATLSATIPKERFGILDIDFDSYRVNSFKEKITKQDSYINGGYFVLSPKVLDYIDGDETSFEKEPLENLASNNQLNAFLHNGFWQCMDTLRDKNYLEELWNSNKAPWINWD